MGEYQWQMVETPWSVSRFYIYRNKKIDLQLLWIHNFEYAFPWGEREQLKGLHKMSNFTDNFQFGVANTKRLKTTDL
jgi:hypothetical protein